MEQEKMYITINHLDEFQSTYMYRPGDTLTLKKDKKNIYDDEAIAAMLTGGTL